MGIFIGLDYSEALPIVIGTAVLFFAISINKIIKFPLIISKLSLPGDLLFTYFMSYILLRFIYIIDIIESKSKNNFINIANVIKNIYSSKLFYPLKWFDITFPDKFYDNDMFSVLVASIVILIIYNFLIVFTSVILRNNLLKNLKNISNHKKKILRKTYKKRMMTFGENRKDILKFSKNANLGYLSIFSLFRIIKKLIKVLFIILLIILALIFQIYEFRFILSMFKSFIFNIYNPCLIFLTFLFFIIIIYIFKIYKIQKSFSLKNKKVKFIFYYKRNNIISKIFQSKIYIALMGNTNIINKKRKHIIASNINKKFNSEKEYKLFRIINNYLKTSTNTEIMDLIIRYLNAK